MIGILRIMFRSLWGLRKGIAFRCQQCGGCCLWPGSVYFTPDELSRAASACGLSIPEFVARYRLRRLGQDEWELVAARGCPLLDPENRCSIYQARPLQCASYPFWRSKTKNATARREFIRECPGSRQGPWFNTGEIERKISSDPRNNTF